MPKIKDLGINVIPDTMRPPEIGGGGGCGCTNITNPCIGCTNNLSFCQAPSHCACTFLTNPCIGCTHNLTFDCAQPSICACTLASPCHTGGTLCGVLSACGHGGATVCACSAVASICTGGSPTIITVTPTTPQIIQAGGLTREHIATLKDQLRQHISALEEAEKSIGPRTAEAIDAREKELNAELEQLRGRRSELGKK